MTTHSAPLRSSTTSPRAERRAPEDALSARAPWRSTIEQGPVREAATVRGAIPEWLRGDLVRTAPAVFERETSAGRFVANHWFDALGMLFSFRITSDGVRFTQRLMETDVEKAARSGDVPFSQFGTNAKRGALRRIFEPVARITDNTNVHTLPFGDERVALTESPHQWVYDDDSLAVVRRVTYTDGLGELAMIAHAQFDFDRRLVVNVASRLGVKNQLIVYEHAPSSRERKVVAEIPVDRVPYVHSFGLTAKHAILFAHPIEWNPRALLFSNGSLLDAMTDRTDGETVLHVVDRATGAVRTHTAPRAFVFHTVNAFEDGDETVLDVAQYEGRSVVDALSRSALLEKGLPDLRPSIVRYRLRRDRKEATVEVLLADGFEFPSINYRRASGARHSVTYGTRILGGKDPSTIVVRLDAHGARTRPMNEWVVGEPLFVERPGATSEDDGVLVVVGSAKDRDESALFVLDPRSLETVATATIQRPLPLGFHGSFFNARG
ncbi:MAG: carotenoid oxygenase family protein [Myxococcales bacterium]|nr:carotenoid oxygenase family protein [Myxococcales bacterium]